MSSSPMGASLMAPKTLGSLSEIAMLPPIGALRAPVASFARRPLEARPQESGILRETREVDFLPCASLGVHPALSVPFGNLGGRGRRRKLGQIAQAKHPPDDNARLQFARPRPEHNEATLARAARGTRVVAEKDAEIDDAVEVPADVRYAEKPRLRQRHGRDLRYGDHFARVGKTAQPVDAAAREAETRRV